jgi:DNA-directed RNA polymerase subunit M/transcription elongation factor TFIIS
MNCPCCGDVMEPVEELEVSIKYRCKSCGLSDTRLKEKKET